VWHSLQLLLCILNGLGDISGQLGKAISQTLLIRSGISALRGVLLGPALDLAGWVGTLDLAVGIFEDTGGLFNEGLDGLHKLFLVDFILGLFSGLVEMLDGALVGCGRFI